MEEMTLGNFSEKLHRTESGEKENEHESHCGCKLERDLLWFGLPPTIRFEADAGTDKHDGHESEGFTSKTKEQRRLLAIFYPSTLNLL